MPRNERLLDALNKAELTAEGLAARVEVDPKTVERWITHGRAPYPKHRHRVAVALGASERWLWEHAIDEERRAHASQSEVVRVYAHRHQIPNDTWLRLFTEASERIDVLVYAGLFLPEQTPRLCELFADKAEQGVQVRLLLGDPDSEHVRIRGEEEGIGDAVATKIRNVLHLYRALFDSRVEVRLHATTLYASIYRGDEQMIASTHVLGLPGAQSPALELRRLAAGDLFDTYAACFERVWRDATLIADRAG